jgi:hypothetical protein
MPKLYLVTHKQYVVAEDADDAIERSFTDAIPEAVEILDDWRLSKMLPLVKKMRGQMDTGHCTELDAIFDGLQCYVESLKS